MFAANQKNRVLSLLLFLLLGSGVALGQSSSFTYQGRLTDSGTTANGNYDLQFALWDSLSGGTQIGSTQTLSTVAVTGGVFTVSLDFGASSFPGAPRFLEISARPSGGSFTLLTPRQPITSTPYALRALNASSADSVPVNAVPAGSGNYIQNTSSAQTGDFNISGNGTAGGQLSGNVVNAATQFNLGGSRVLSISGTSNIFAGVGAGANNTTGQLNAFLGSFAGTNNQTGGENAFVGYGTGFKNATGSFNTMLGYFANVGGGNLTNATAIGANALVAQNNSLVLGSINGMNGGTANTNVGIGTPAPLAPLDVRGNVFIGLSGDPSSAGANALFLANDFGDSRNSFRIDADTNNLYIIGRSNAGAAADTGIIFRTAVKGGSAGSGGNEPDRVRIDGAGNVGVGTDSPQTKLDVRGDVKLGSTGQLFAPGGEENLRIIRGTIGANGDIINGIGFTVSHSNEGVYYITFNTPFSGAPAVTVTPERIPNVALGDVSVANLDPDCGCKHNEQVKIVIINTRNSNGVSFDFDFIAIGPR